MTEDNYLCFTTPKGKNIIGGWWTHYKINIHNIVLKNTKFFIKHFKRQLKKRQFSVCFLQESEPH